MMKKHLSKKITGILMVLSMLLALIAVSCAQPNEIPTDSDMIETSMDVANEITNDTETQEVDTASSSDTFQPIPFCQGTTALLYDPMNSDELEMWPDDRLTIQDDQSPTGIRLNINSKNAKWTMDVPDFIKGAVSQFQTLSGFALNGEVLMRFTGPITKPPATYDASMAAKELLFVDLTTKTLDKVAYEAKTGNDDKDLFIQPILPLKPGHEYAVVMTTSYKAEDGDCIAPSRVLQAMLSGRVDDEAMKKTGQRMLNALKTLNIEPEDVSGMTVFTTENDLVLIREAAKDAEKQDHDWLDRKECTIENNIKSCDMEFQAGDYRTDGFISTPKSKKTWKVPVTIWMPANEKGPFPTIIFGHGIGGDRWQGASFASRVCPDGFAVIAAPALRHGMHPTANPDDKSQAAVEFLGFDLKNVAFNPMELRGNFNQTTMDRVRLLATMLKYPDVDGDGTADVDKKHIIYWGLSLGSLLGPSIVSLEDSIRAAIFTVGGGRLLLFATTGDKVKQFKPIIINLIGSEERFNRLLVPIQSIVDAADPDSYAPHVLKDRFSGSNTIPSVLFPVADKDDTVPPACGHAMAQALEIPQMKPVRTPVPMLDVLDAPVKGNMDSQKATAAYFQFDRVGGANPEPAKHNNTPLSPEATLQARHFLKTWLSDGISEIIDPYPVIGTPPLP